MRILNRPLLTAFNEAHSGAKKYLLAWLNEAEHATWQTPTQIKNRYASASILKDNRVVFNIKANDYRLLVKINYPAGIVQILFIGTHAEYDKIDAEKYT